MKTVILAAGKGTRLGDLTKHTPKPMLVVAGRPVLEHIILHIRQCGITDFALVTRYLSEKIEEHFKDGSPLDIKVSYIPQPEAYGTGAALLAARSFVNDDSVMMTFGDVVTSPDAYAGVLDIFNNTQCDGAIALNWVEDPWKGAAVMTDPEGTVVQQIREKPKQGEVVSHWMNAGIFAFKPVVFDYLEKLKPSVRGEYEFPDAINAMINDGLTVRPYFMKGPWQDVGTVEDLQKAEKLLGG
ncbi:MAG: nucleotidyltransferase family protein [Armatimonadota bacterium]|nr:nucleotidyltransferase family protein [bacterium]